MDSVKLKARAKINIGLDVVRKREDGYHDMRMIMQTLSMYDDISVTKIKKRDIEISNNLFYVPNDENNICYKAAKLIMDTYGIDTGVSINLKKYIPVSAGMAGGSADAAAVMIGMNRLFALGLPENRLMELGVSIGADVPYCIMKGTALAEGIGEKLTRLKPFPECYVVVAKPAFSVSTKMVFSKLVLTENTKHPDIDAIMSGIRIYDIKKICENMGNVLEEVTIKEHPVIETIKKRLVELGALSSLMSGSGPTVFGLFDDIRTAKKACDTMREERLARNIYITEIFNV